MIPPLDGGPCVDIDNPSPEGGYVMAPLMGGGSGSGVPVAALFPNFPISGAFFVKLFGMDVFLGFQGSRFQGSKVSRFSGVGPRSWP